MFSDKKMLLPCMEVVLNLDYGGNVKMQQCFFLYFLVQPTLTKPKAMEPIAPIVVRGPVPIPPQRANKTTNSGVNPPRSTSALPPNLNNSVSTNQTNKGNT